MAAEKDAETPETTAETGKANGKVPESDRPNVSGVSFGDDLGEDGGDGLDYETYPDATPEAPLGFLATGEPRKRRKRGTASSGPRVSPTVGGRGKSAVRAKAAQGATILYGGIGVILAGTGLAPGAGFSMQGLADEAGVPIADWAEKRSPKFFQFLSTLSDATGVGKFVAAPVAAEAYVRMPPVRTPIGPVIEAVHGPEGMAAFADLAENYDAYRFGQEAERATAQAASDATQAEGE